jgi:hypothetical protein
LTGVTDVKRKEEGFNKHLLVMAMSLVIAVITISAPTAIKVASAQTVVVPLQCNVVTKGGVATLICCREDPFEMQSICEETPLISQLPEFSTCDPKLASCLPPPPPKPPGRSDGCDINTQCCPPAPEETIPEEIFRCIIWPEP